MASVHKTTNPYTKSAPPQKFESAVYEKSSPILLSQQAAVAHKPKPVNNADWQTLKGHLEGRLVSLRNWRQSWWTQNWSQLAEFILPRRSIWLTQSAGGLPTPNNMTRGREINQSIVDPTATFAVRVCAGGLMSGLASPSRPWFKVIPGVKNLELDEAGKKWLDETEERIYSVLAGSNFYNSFAQECEDLVVFGTAPVIIYEDEQDLIRFYNPTVGEYYLSASATLRIDGLYRAFVMTIAQVVDFFGLDNCPVEMQTLWQAKGASLQQEVIVAHSIEPNFGVQRSNAGKIPGKYTWREVYWLYGNSSEKPLSMRGFMDTPFTCGRWATQSNDAYGRSPGMDVLPDVMQLQSETRRKAEGIEKQVRPPLIADMKLKNQPASVLPGHVTYVDGLTTGSGMRSIYEVNPDLKAMAEDLMQIQQRIKVGLFNDVILMLQSSPKDQRTAFEVSEMVAERMQVFGPIVESLITESLKPKLKRVFSIMKRRGFISPPPDSLKNIPLDVTFISTFALAQKAAVTGGMERMAALIGNLSAEFPAAKDVLDVDLYLREMNELLGNPQQILKGPEEVAAIRQQQAQQAQAQNQLNMAHGAAQTASVGADAANTLANTQIGGGQQALAAILGTGQQ